MADPIKLPPLPSRPIGMSVNDHIRARDLEVAKAVLEGAIARVESRYAYEAKAMAHHAGTWYAASEYHANRVTAASQMLDVLRALEVKHHG